MGLRLFIRVSNLWRSRDVCNVDVVYCIIVHGRKPEYHDSRPQTKLVLQRDLYFYAADHHRQPTFCLLAKLEYTQRYWAIMMQ